MIEILHNRLANTVLLYFLLMLIWSGWRLLRKEGTNGSYRGALVISSVLVLVQGALGAILWLGDQRPEAGSAHVLYGVIGILGIPFVFSIFRNRTSRYEVLTYSLLYLFLVGIVFRAIATG